MWVYAQGRYEITKQKKDGFYFRLQSRELNGEYRTYKTKGNDWLLERLDAPQVDWLQDPIEPMLANSKKSVPDTDEFLYEVKWDGIRAMISLDEGEVRILSRNQRDITVAFPELLVPDESFRGSSLLIDTEIVCLDGEGRPVFKDVINRMRQTSESAIKRGMSRHKAVCYVFDLLYLDGRHVTGEPLERRREWMEDVIKKGGAYRVSETVDDGTQLFAAAEQLGLEGIMAKDRHSTYHPGKRTSQWLKVKTRQTMDCVIVGYTRGRGDREATFGALHLAQRNGDDLRYVGKVGTGFDDRLLKNVLTELKKVKEAPTRPVKEKPIDDAQSVWLQPDLYCEVQYASITNKGTLREPVFLRLRPDLASD